MSGILKSNILGRGVLEQQLYDAFIAQYGPAWNTATSQDPPLSPEGYLREFCKKLADAISDGVAKGVQQYLTETVKTVTDETAEIQDSSTDPPHLHAMKKSKWDLDAP
jgi:hypothetical protein